MSEVLVQQSKASVIISDTPSTYCCHVAFTRSKHVIFLDQSLLCPLYLEMELEGLAIEIFMLQKAIFYFPPFWGKLQC